MGSLPTPLPLNSCDEGEGVASSYLEGLVVRLSLLGSQPSWRWFASASLVGGSPVGWREVLSYLRRSCGLVARGPAGVRPTS